MILVAVSLEEEEDIFTEKSGVNVVYFIRGMPAFKVAMKMI